MEYLNELKCQSHFRGTADKAQPADSHVNSDIPLQLREHFEMLFAGTAPDTDYSETENWSIKFTEHEFDFYRDHEHRKLDCSTAELCKVFRKVARFE